MDYGLTFAAVIYIYTYIKSGGYTGPCGNVEVPVKHGDIPNTYVKADKEEHLEINLQLPQGIDVNYKILQEHGARGTIDRVLDYARACMG